MSGKWSGQWLCATNETGPGDQCLGSTGDSAESFMAVDPVTRVPCEEDIEISSL